MGASDYTEPAVELAFNNNTAGMPNYCYDGSSTYSYRSKEWNAVTYREGFAHFVSAATWNVKEPSGTFYWGAVPSTNYPPTDLWRFGPSYEQSGSNAAGGLLEQVCDGDNDDAATNEDMVRFLWSFYNANSGNYCGSGETPTGEQMLKLYARVRLNGGLTQYNYMASTESAAEQIGLPSCLAQAGTADEYKLLPGAPWR